MTTIDELGGEAASVLLADVGDLAGPAAFQRGLAKIRAEAGPQVAASGRRGPTRSTRWRFVTAAAAAAAVAVVAGVIVTRDDEPRQIDNVPVAPVDSAVPTTSPTTFTTDAPSTETSTIEVPETGPLHEPELAQETNSTTFMASYLDPPPTFEPEPYSSGQLADPAAAPAVAVTEYGAVIVDGIANTATILDGSGTATDVVRLAVDVAYPIAGPGDVLYGLVNEGPSPDDAAMVAIALAGPSRGQVIAAEPIDVNLLIESPISPLGHGSSGIVLRQREIGRQLIAYVDSKGAPVSFDAAPMVTIDDANLVATDGGRTWQLGIERDPTCCRSFNSNSPPAPAAGGGATYWTEIGAPVDPSADFSPSTINVIADLRSDGTGQWWTLPDAWSVVASDQWGTLLGRIVGDEFELARFPREVEGAAVKPFEPDLPADLSRPLLNGPNCTSSWTREVVVGPFQPFAHHSDLPISVQVYASRSGSIEDPYVVALRYFQNQSQVTRPNADIDGVPARSEGFDFRGGGSLSWLLPDGSQMYLRTRGLSQTSLLAFAATLIPRSGDDPVPGVDADGSFAALSLLDETVTPLEIPVLAMSGCAANSGVFGDMTVRTLVGRPAATFTAFVDQPAPYPPVRMLPDGTGTVSITYRGDASAANQAFATLRQGDEPEWRSLLVQPSADDIMLGGVTDQPAVLAALAGRSFATMDDVAAAAVEAVRAVMPADELAEGVEPTAVVFDSVSGPGPTVVVTTRHLDDSVIATAWFVHVVGSPPEFSVDTVRSSDRCRNGVLRAPDGLCT